MPTSSLADKKLAPGSGRGDSALKEWVKSEEGLTHVPMDVHLSSQIQTYISILKFRFFNERIHSENNLLLFADGLHLYSTHTSVSDPVDLYRYALRGWRDGSAGKAIAAKSDDLSSTPGSQRWT